MASSEETEEPKEKPETPMIPSQGKDQNKADPESETNVKNPDFSEEHPSPRGVLEIPILGSDSDSTTSSSCSSSSTEKLVKHQGLVHDYHLLHWKSLIENIKNKSVRRLPTFSKLTSSEISKRNLNRKLARLRTRSQDRIDCGAPLIPKPSWRSFDLEELVVATENFSSEKLIGKGGHAEVYKGCLTDGQLVAVKRLLKKQNEEERTGDFLSELGIIAHIDHPNAARLLGFSSDGGLHLVLQFSPQGSLASLLHGSEESLDWKIRYKVALGVAEGLNYLHRGCHRRIIHRDIKASNILLTEDFEPQISDFGLAKWLPDEWAHHVVFPIEGTFGYLAPEYFMHGIVDEKTDVFAFGVLLLEIVTGRRAVDSCRQSLVMWAKPLLDTNNVKELADPRLGDDYNLVEMKNAMTTASMCVHHLSTARPHMSRVLQLLRGEDGSLEVMGRDQKPSAERAILVDACELEDYTCSSYLKDLNRHRQLALE